MQKWYRQRRAQGALRRLHAAHVTKLLSTQAEWKRKLREQAASFQSAKGTAQRVSAAGYIRATPQASNHDYAQFLVLTRFEGQ